MNEFSLFYFLVTIYISISVRHLFTMALKKLKYKSPDGITAMIN